MAPIRMAVGHPIDEEIRARLRAVAPNQADFAKAIGRSKGWLNKYMHGAGTATIDDVVRIAAMLIGATAAPALTESERKLLRAWNQIPTESQADAVAFFEVYARRLRRAPPLQSTAPEEQTPRATKHRAHGKR